MKIWRGLLFCVAGAQFGAASAGAQTPLTPLHTFTASPNSRTQHPDGNLYGTSGSGEGSTFFRMTPDGAFTPLHTFTAAESRDVTLGADGNFYGTTPSVWDFFTRSWTPSRAFRLTPLGDVTLLGSFAGGAGFTLRGSDGSFYGTGQFQSCGAFGGSCTFYVYVFRMTLAGSNATLFSRSFISAPDSLSVGVETSDGTVYGTEYNLWLPFATFLGNRIF